MNDGFDGDLIFQIADELRQRFPLIFEGHDLRQAWCVFDSWSNSSSSRLLYLLIDRFIS